MVAGTTCMYSIAALMLFASWSPRGFRSWPYMPARCIFVEAMRWESSDPYILHIEASMFGTPPRAWIETTTNESSSQTDVSIARSATSSLNAGETG